MAPFKKATRKEIRLMQKPWISRDILNKRSKRDNLLKDISKENDLEKRKNLQSQYKILRNEITREKRDSKKSYYSAHFEKNRKNSSEIWKGIRFLVNMKLLLLLLL